MPKYQLLMPFLDDDPVFTHGYECGLLDERMKNNINIEKQPVHNVNIGQIKIIAEYYGYELNIKEMDDTWSSLNASPVDISSLVK